MPTNVFQGDNVEFTVQFTDLSGNVVVPSSATLSINYINLSGATASSCMPLVLTDVSIWTASWGSSVSNPCNAVWSIMAANTINVPTQTGVLRIVQEQ